jgi:hypothetical protein
MFDSVLHFFRSVDMWVYVITIFALQGFVVFIRRSTDTWKRADVYLESQRVIYEQKAVEKPEDPKSAWDLARVTLEQYFNRNLQQVGMIFNVAVAVMLAGFLLIVAAVILAMKQASLGSLAGELTAASGIITEFISLTFMVIYRSTLRQANGYMAILERINAVGMAVQITESIPPIDPKFAESRASIANHLMAQLTAPALKL